MEEKKNLVILSIVVLISIAAFIYLIIKVGKIGVGRYKTYYAIFDSTKGLAQKADVRLGGIKVGFVEKMQIILNEKEVKVKIQMKIASDTPIRKDFEAQIRMKSLLGEKYIELIPTGEGDTSLAEENFTITRTRILFEPDELIMALKPFVDSVNPDLIKDLSKVIPTLVNSSQPLIDNTSKILESLSDILPKTQKLIEDFTSISDKLISLVDVLSRNQNAIDRSLSTLPQLTESTNKLITNISGTISQADLLLSILREYQNSLTHSVATLPQLLSESLKTIQFINSTIPEFQELLTSTTKTIIKLQEVLDKGVKVRIF